MADQPTAILLLALLLAVLSFTIALPPETISDAADTLSGSGYYAMSLTLNLVSASLLSGTSSVTIFTPPDDVFADHGEPSLSLLSLHFSPLVFSLSGLRSLPFGTKIPTMSSDNHLTITTPPSSDQVSLNGVKIVGPPIFDDGLLMVFGIDNFFDPNFTVPNAPVEIPSFNDCGTFSGAYNSNFSFHGASNVLISRGYSVMASFLNLQLLGFTTQPSLTVFAPVDEVMIDYSDRFPEYPSLFLRHVLPCKISWRDLVTIDNGTSLNTYRNGFRINVTRSDVTLKVNEVEITFPDMYYSDWLVIHGVQELLSLPKPADDLDDSDGGSFGPVHFGTASNQMTVPSTSNRTEL